LATLLLGCQSVPVDSSAKAVDANAEASEFNLQAGLGYLRQQQYQRALLKFEKALQQDETNLEAAMGQAAALQSLGRRIQAETVYEDLLADFPKRYEPASAYAGLLCEQQRFQEAESILLTALKKGAFASGDQIYLRLARCAVRGQRNDLAGLYLDRAEAIASETKSGAGGVAEITLQRAWLAYGQQRFETAQQQLEAFERTSPLRPEAVRLGYLIAKAQNNVERMATYGQILRQNYPQLWNQLTAASQQ
jgi:type IV pilus assembly protein PilF